MSMFIKQNPIHTWNLNSLETVKAFYDRKNDRVQFEITSGERIFCPERITSDISLTGREKDITSLFKDIWVRLVDEGFTSTLKLNLKLRGGGGDGIGVVSVCIDRPHREAIDRIGLLNGTSKQDCERELKMGMPDNSYHEINVWTSDYHFPHIQKTLPTRIVELRFTTGDSVKHFFKKIHAIFSQNIRQQLEESENCRAQGLVKNRLINAIFGSQDSTDQKELIAAFNGKLDLTLYIAMDASQMELAFDRYHPIQEGSSSCSLQ